MVAFRMDGFTRSKPSLLKRSSAAVKAGSQLVLSSLFCSASAAFRPIISEDCSVQLRSLSDLEAISAISLPKVEQPKLRSLKSLRRRISVSFNSLAYICCCS